MYKICHFLKIEIFGPSTKTSEFSWILVLLSIEMSLSGTYISSLNISHLLEFGKFFQVIYKQVMYLASFPSYKFWILPPKIQKIT